LAAAARECCHPHHSLVIPSEAELVWICYDTPIIDGVVDSVWVMDRIDELIPSCNPEAIMLVSSQLPVGSIASLEYKYPGFRWACSPENIRVASAVADFQNQSRIILGVRTAEDAKVIYLLLTPFTHNIIITGIETAEMCKHALNCWLGMNIAFINEISRICKVVGADVDGVTESLKSERRISPNAPLKAGAPFGGGHLARDIYFLGEIAERNSLSTPIINSILKSNNE